MRGNNYTFLGMSIEIKKNIIHIDMVEQLRDCMEYFGEYVSSPVSPPAKKKLEVREDAEHPSDKKGDLLHLVAANYCSL